MKLSIWNAERAGSFRITVTDEDAILEYHYVTHDQEPFNKYSFLTPVQAVQGIQDTSVWLKSVKEYPGALELVLTGETDEETLQFSLENEILLKPIGAEHPEASF